MDKYAIEVSNTQAGDLAERISEKYRDNPKTSIAYL
jgi:hypothetical protein